MNKTVLLFGGGVILLAFVFFAFANTFLFSNNAPTGAATIPSGTAPSGDVQTIQLSTNGLSYSPSVITVKQNQPVRLVGGDLQGCSRAFVIPQLGIRKVFQQNDNVLEFTPTVKGSFVMSCSMGMYKGTFNVV